MTSVLHQAASLSTNVQPVITSDFTYGVWLKCNGPQYGTGTFNSLFGFGVSGGSSEGLLVQVDPSTNTSLSVVVFRAAGSDIQTVSVLTGSDQDWIHVSLRHNSGSSVYDLSFRRQNQFSYTTVSLPLASPLVSPGSIYLGTSQFGNTSLDSDARSFFCQQSRLSDSALLLASQNLDSPPVGNNIHWLRLLDAASATSNGGTGGDWTPSGSLQTANSQPAETLFSSPLFSSVILSGFTF